jgi:hypothetical protein
MASRVEGNSKPYLHLKADFTLSLLWTLFAASSINTHRMRLLSLIISVCLITNIYSAAQNFEGTIELDVKITGAQAAMMSSMMPNKMVYKFKGEDTRMAILGGFMPQDILMLGKENVAWILHAEQKRASKIKLDDDDKSKGKSPKINATDEYKDILGYRCRKYLIDMPAEKGAKKGVTGTFWVTKELKVKNPKVEGNKLFADGLEGFPLQVDMDFGMEGMRMQMIATNIDTKVPSSADFEIPADYTKGDFILPDFKIPNSK